MKLTKIIGLASMAAVSALAIAGCGNKSSDGGKVSLSINYYNGAISKQAIKNTKAKFPKYKLTFKQVPANEDYDTKLKASLSSTSAPDIAAINSNIVDYLPYKEKFVNLADYGTDKVADQYVAWKWDSTFATKDYQIAMPIDIGPTAFMYNVANFKKAGLPTDPDEVSAGIKSLDGYMNYAKQLKEKANKPMWLGAVALLQEMEQKMTKDMYSANGKKLTLGDGQLKDAWDFTVKGLKAGYMFGVKANSSDNVNAQQKGMYSGMIQASWGIADLKENGTKNNSWLIARAPGEPANSGGSYLAVIKTTKHAKQAAEVVKYLTNKKNQEANYKELALFPSVKALYNDDFKNVTDPLFGDEKYNKYFIESANELEYTKADPRSTAVRQIFENQMQLVQDSNKNPDKAWKEAVAKAEAIQ
ncbi:ABC transporter substrate-binding protein [Lacticaseibacillus nasuensis]|uniref:ABC transporter substrate-binding protein n=1 Tax=Lacticaseibacillus nasuensis TaxID=944671 RepID=UPI0022469C36|nr:ABC transporter substrate-binding protein [Lacticaseibacillus nasuensis]MCX2454493.1 ABC transporter substrate-binding protein [Lacticaseibacillus nasuensis]